MKKHLMYFQKSTKGNNANTLLVNVNLDDILPICADYSMKGGNIWRINLAGMEKHSPTGDNWGYAPFQKTYKTEKEAKEVRLEIYETMKRAVINVIGSYNMVYILYII